MSYLVTVTFDLHEVPEEAWEEVYKAAYTALAKIGLTRIATSDNKTAVRLPESTVMGELQGESAAGLRDKICSDLVVIFKAQNRKYTVFVTVGGDWAWGRRTG